MFPFVAIAGFLLLAVATAVLAERRAGLPPAARPAKRAMFACAAVGALSLGWIGYTLVTTGPLWWLVAAAVLALAAVIGILLAARAMLRAHGIASDHSGL